MIILCVICTSCQKSETTPFVPEDCGTDTISYNQEIVPEILDASCNVSGCHDATGKAGYELTNHSLVSSDTDPLYRVMAHEDGYKPMPPSSDRLPDSLLQKFYCWIQQGRLDN